LLETVYSRAVCLELAAAGLAHETEKRVPIYYRNQLLCEHRLDIVGDDKLILELKAVEKLTPVFHAQILGYMRAARKQVGLLINFNVPVLSHGLRRFVL
jgi:GxxExxY protein